MVSYLRQRFDVREDFISGFITTTMIVALFFAVVGWFLFKVRQHMSKYPDKSLIIAIINTVMIPMRLFGMPPFYDGVMSIDRGMEDARKQTKLSDFGDLTFVDSYKIVAASPLYKSLKFTNLGFFVAKNELHLTLVRRLLFTQYLKDTPDVLKVPIKAPVFVFGLGRSGTTFVHRLLSLDPKVRSPSLWELIMPVPKVKGSASKEKFAQDREERANFIRAKIAERNWMGDKSLENFHEVGADLPEECLFAMSDEIPTSFHYVYSCLCNPSIFLEKIDSKRIMQAYSSYKKVLQLLSYQVGDLDNSRRWVLKCPLHILFIKELAAIFPDAKLVWAHRHPIPTVSSLCSLLRAMHGLYYEKETCRTAEVGKAIHELASKVLKRAPEQIKETGLPCANVVYSELVKDPVAMVRLVYTQLGWEFTPEYETILVDYLEDNRKQREELKAKNKAAGKKETLHDHRPEDFDLTPAQLTAGNFQRYMETYDITSAK